MHCHHCHYLVYSCSAGTSDLGELQPAHPSGSGRPARRHQGAPQQEQGGRLTPASLPGPVAGLVGFLLICLFISGGTCGKGGLMYFCISVFLARSPTVRVLVWDVPLDVDCMLCVKAWWQMYCCISGQAAPEAMEASK